MPVAPHHEPSLTGGFARIEIVCPNTTKKAGPNIFPVRLLRGTGGGSQVDDFLKKIVPHLTEDFLRKLLKRPKPAPLSQAFPATETVFFAWGAPKGGIGTPFDCC
jgi:hypothetical protein